MDISLAGLLGAVLGTVVAAVIYAPLERAIENRILRSASSEPPDRPRLAQEIALLRRSVFAVNMLLCAGIGYWVGQTISG